MRQHKKPNRGYVNQSYGVTTSEEERQSKVFGPKYTSIDFGFNPDLSVEDFPIRNATVLGSLIIGDYEVELTKAECEKIMYTMHEAMQSSQKRYRLGILQK